MCKWRIENNTTFLLNLKKKQSLNDAKMQPVFIFGHFNQIKNCFQYIFSVEFLKTKNKSIQPFCVKVFHAL